MHIRRLATILLLAAAALATSGACATETFDIDTSHSNVSFKIRHLISNTAGRFSDFSGSIAFDAADPARSSVSLTIKSASIDTADAKRDGHLKSPDFFDVAKYPELTFASTKISKSSGNTYNVTGNFTMHGVTREITIPVEILGVAKDPWGNERAGFSTSFTLDRKDYGIVWNKVLDAGGTLLGNEVAVSINIEAVKAKPKEAPAAK